VKRSGRKSAAQTPAPPSERIRGSRKNPKGSAASKESANKINVSDKIAETLSNKAKEYNEKHPKNKVTLATLKAVFRRGAGAYSSSHRPTISGGRPNSRTAWAYARVNKFLLKKGGAKVKAAYVQDDDLMENGGILDSSCKRYISQNESILKTGYYLNFNEFSSMIDPYGQIPLNLNYTLVTYNSGNQDGLSLIDTINPINLQNELAEILNIPLNNAQVVVGLYIEMGKKFKSISQIEGDNILVIDRDKIVCKSGGGDDLMAKGAVIKKEKYDFSKTSIAYKKTEEEEFVFNGVHVPSEQFLFWLYDVPNSQEKINKGVFDEIKFGKGLDSIWQKDVQSKYKGSENLIGVVKFRISDDYSKIYLLTMTTKPSLRRMGIMSYLINKIREKYNIDKINTIFIGPTSQGQKFINKKRYEKGGELGQEITCVNCGWHWNTNQSEAFDKYICHNCGFDNRTFYDSEPIGKYHLGGDMSKHLAPNGKPSNLTHEQWHLVRTPEFKAWFGDWENYPENASKVVDENGEPLVCYHATDKGNIINKFYKRSAGIHFGTKKAAKDRREQTDFENIGYELLEVFLKIKNPLIANRDFNWEWEEMEYVDDFDITQDDEHNLFETYAHKLGYNIFTNEGLLSLEELLYKYDFNGIFYKNQKEDKGSTSYLVFEPTQIKLADGSNTTFDGNNPDIRYEDGGLVIAMEDGGVIDMYTQEKVKKVYVSIKIPYDIGRPQAFAPYEVKSVDFKVFKELANGKLLGVEGVSTSKYNIADWLSHRQCLVLMNFNEFTAINNDEQIEYDNVDYLTKDGFDILYRIYNKKEKTDRDYYGILQNLFPKIALEFELEAKIVSGAKYKTYSYLESIFNQYRSGAFLRWFADQPRVQSVSDMVDYTEKYLMSGQSRTDYTYFDTPSDLDKEDLKRIISRGIIRAIKVYTDESEVVLKDKTLNIPEGSRLIFVLGNYDNMKSMYQEMIQQYGLSEKYKINFVKEKDVVAYQQKKVVMQEKAFKQELEQKKLKVDAKIKKVLEQILNEAVEYFETKLVSEINDRYTPPYTDYDDGTDYGDNPLAIPKFDEYYLSAISRFIEIYESEIPNIVATKNKYVFLDVFTRFERYIRDMKREVMQEEQVQIAEDRNYSRIYAETFYEAFVSLFSFSDFSIFINDIKEKIGVDLVLAYDSKDLMLKDGGEIEDDKKIALPDTYSKEKNLKRVLNMQGYDLKKIEEESDEANEDIMKKGGVVVGKSHQEADENGTGEKFVVASTGQIVELEGGEAVIVNKAMDADDEMEFEGEKMTPKQIASYLNHAYGGVKFEKGGELTCGCTNKKYYHGGELPSAVVNGLEGGEAVITKKTMESKDKYTFQGQKLTPRQILSRINHKYGGVSFARGGITTSIKHSEENKGTKMMYFLNNVIYG
jgi:hypothetical protein